MFRLRQALWGGLVAGLVFITGCASFSNDCTPRQGLFARLGLCNRNNVVTEGPCCASPVNGGPIYSGPIIATPTFGGPYPTVPAGDFVVPPAEGTVFPHTGGPVLPPTTTVPPTLPYPSSGPGTLAPGTVLPGGPPGDARPVPAGPSSRRI